MTECEKYMELISGLVDGELSEEEEKEVREHMDGCESCRRMYEVFMALSKEHVESEKVPATLKDSVMYHVSFTKRDRPKGKRSSWKNYITVAAAVAAVVIVVSRWNSGTELPEELNAGLNSQLQASAGTYENDDTSDNGTINESVSDQAAPENSQADAVMTPSSAMGSLDKEHLVTKDFGEEVSSIVLINGSVPEQLAEYRRVSIDENEIVIIVPSDVAEQLQSEVQYAEIIYLDNDTSNSAVIVCMSD